MSLNSFFHIFLHFALVAAIAGLFFRSKFWTAFLIMAAANLIDLDHLLADQVFKDGRCSVGFHLLHDYWALAVYFLLALIPKTRLIGLGLIIHVAVDGLDCLM